jgi:hypothetical protein
LAAGLCFYQEQLSLAQPEEWHGTSWIGAVAEHRLFPHSAAGIGENHARRSELFASIRNATVSAVELPPFVQHPTILAAENSVSRRSAAD